MKLFKFVVTVNCPSDWDEDEDKLDKICEDLDTLTISQWTSVLEQEIKNINNSLSVDFDTDTF